MARAGDFAASPSGYVITVFVTVTFALIGAIWVDLRLWRSRTDRALAEQTRALAVVVTSAENTGKTADAALSASRALEVQTGILRQRLDTLEAAKDRDHARYDAALTERRRQPKAQPSG